MISSYGFDVIGICSSGSETMRKAREMQPSLVIVSYKLNDMMGSDLANNLGTFCGVILLATEGQKEWLNTLDDDVVVMTYPINKAAFVQAIDIMVRMQCRIGSLTRRIHELTHSIEDKQLIDRAKRHLMQIHDIQEYEAHRQLQKLSMDSGQRMADVARIILEHI